MTRTRSTKIKLSLAAAAIAAAGLFFTTDVANAEPHTEHYDYYGDGYYYDNDRYGTVHGGINYDRNGDGVLSYREQLVERFDRNHDGRIDNAEQRAYQNYKRNLDRRGYRDSYGDRGYGYGYANPYGGDRSPEHLDEHDLNKDGVIDHYEMQQLNRHDQLEDLFKHYDRNADGYLSFSESNRTPVRRHFRSADHDVNGYLSWNELEHYLEAPEQHRPIPRQPAYRGGFPGRWIR